MYSFFYGEIPESIIREKSNTYFIELSSGVYQVEKDKYGDFNRLFVGANSVVNNLNERNKVAIKTLDGLYILNSNLEELKS